MFQPVANTDTAAERTIVFVASDNSEDRAHERVEIATFYLPTKNGGLVRNHVYKGDSINSA